jgi:hypothetical protein
VPRLPQVIALFATRHRLVIPRHVAEFSRQDIANPAPDPHDQDRILDCDEKTVDVIRQGRVKVAQR